ncbi:MAG: OmpA family protein [Elusimicrobia bacterium]|nr:OmpA family protein [Elusimicrobiota bacterium]
MNRKRTWAVCAWVVCGASSLWGEIKDAWGVELDAGGVAAVGSSVVRSEGKSGFSAGGLVRYGGHKGWSKGFGYNVLSLQNGHRLKPVTFVGDRRGSPWGTWSPFARLGAGIGTDKEAGSMNRLVFRGGVGVRRPIHPRWDLGLKSELWFSPSSGGTGETMTLVTVGVTLARSFKTIPRKEPIAKPVEQKQTQPAEETSPGADNSPTATASEGSPAMVIAPAAATTAETAAPAVGVTSHKINILFQFDRSDREGSDLEAEIPALEEIAKILRNDPAAEVEIHGHADSRGPLGYNIALSRKRANTVRDFFVSRWGLDKKRFTIFAHGPKKPAASNATPLGRAKNRRVLVLLIP